MAAFFKSSSGVWTIAKLGAHNISNPAANMIKLTKHAH
jgi:hypothetical protein